MLISNKKENIILIGFMGTGKTAVAKLLSSQYDLKYIDTDELIEKKTKKSISDIFSQHGGEYFRELENKVLQELKDTTGAVISTGGGIVLREDNRRLLKNMGMIFHLKASFETILKRVEGTDNRPLLDNIDRYQCVSSLWKKRKAFYDIADQDINTDVLTLNEIPVLINLLFNHSIVYDVSTKKTPVVCKTNLISNIELFFKHSQNGKGKRIVITDENVNNIYRRSFDDKADDVIVLEPGECVKSIENLQMVYDHLIDKNYNRNDLVICIGGGTVLDFGGYVASSFKRGMRLCFIPTTLLSLVDASVGGKNGINYSGVKNIIGSFYQPDMIIADPFFLKTLPERELFSGYGELIKYILLTGQEKNFILEKDVSKAVLLAIRYKSYIVEKDERDLDGERALLNLGHTFAHVIEALSENKVSHGQAVADGLIYAYKLSLDLGHIKKGDLLHVYELREKYGIKELFLNLKVYDVNEVITLLKKDKKNISDDITFILPVRKESGIEFEIRQIETDTIKRLWSVL